MSHDDATGARVETLAFVAADGAVRTIRWAAVELEKILPALGPLSALLESDSVPFPMARVMMDPRILAKWNRDRPHLQKLVEAAVRFALAHQEFCKDTEKPAGPA